MFQVVSTPIDADAVRQAVEGPDNGAVVVFYGTVRNRTEGRGVTHLEYEAYASMAEAVMTAIGVDIQGRLGLSALACIHRTGRLEIGDTAVVAAASSPHRGAALEGIEAFIRRLKEDVPIWKKEHFEDGATWIGTPADPQGRSTGVHARTEDS